MRRPGPQRRGPGRRSVRSAPASDVENHPEAGLVVLPPDVEMLAGLGEEPAGPLRAEVVERADAQAAVALQVIVGAVVQARPQVVVVRGRLGRLAVLMNDPVAATGLELDV